MKRKKKLQLQREYQLRYMSPQNNVTVLLLSYPFQKINFDLITNIFKGLYSILLFVQHQFPLGYGTKYTLFQQLVANMILV